MDKFNLITYTKEVMDKLNNESLFMTHMNIAYKVINYYENNIGNITSDKEFELELLINEIYDQYLESNDNDLLDEIIIEIFETK